MKRNQIKMKLSINKTTIANLTNLDLSSLKGGIIDETYTACYQNTCQSGCGFPTTCLTGILVCTNTLRCDGC